MNVFCMLPMAAFEVWSREEYFARIQPDFRLSPLVKRYGWGVHIDVRAGCLILSGLENGYFTSDTSLRRSGAIVHTVNGDNKIAKSLKRQRTRNTLFQIQKISAGESQKMQRVLVGRGCPLGGGACVF